MALTKVTNSMLVQPVNHNILINPGFTVMQRGAVIDHNSNTFGPDRWVVRGVDGVKGTMSQSTTNAPTGINKLVVRHRNATSYANIYQKIEAVNILGLYGKEMTFSFSYSDRDGSGIPKVRVRTYDSSDAEKDIFSAVPTSLGNNRWSWTGTLTTPDGTIPNPSERGMEVLIQPNEGNTAPDEWYVWETKLEAGSVATPFIARSYGEEFALCQRYYQPVLSKGVMTGSARLSDYVYMAYAFPVAMRTSPTLISNGAITIVGDDGYTQSTDKDNTIFGVSNTGVRLQLKNFSSLKVGNAYILAGGGINDIAFMFDAEL